MLNLVFGRDFIPEGGKLVEDPRAFFIKYKKPEWFEDDFVKRFLKEIDNTEVLFEEALKDYRGRGISTEKISTGCKTLCVLYYNDKENLWFNGTGMGLNCLPFLYELVSKKDVNVFFEYQPWFGEEYFDNNLIMMNGKVATEDDVDLAYCEWCELGDRLMRQDFEAKYGK